MLEKYLRKVALLKQAKYVVGEREIAFLRIAVQFFNVYLLKQETKITEQLLINFNQYFLSIGSFLKVLNTYKMDKEVMEILKELNQLLRVPEYESLLLQCVQGILQ